MNWTFAQAAQHAREIVSSTCGEIEAAIIDEATQGFDVGWIFFYQSSRFLETGDVQDSLAGNAPLFVSRKDGHAAFISYQRPIAESIDAYRICGNPNAHEEPQIRLSGWLTGANKIQAIALIRRYAHLNLADAKHAVDRCLASTEATVNTEDVASAKRLMLALTKIGFLATVIYSEQVRAVFRPTNDR
nr:YrhB domain-containing protein [Paraburkholderia phenoliruptrix]